MALLYGNADGTLQTALTLRIQGNGSLAMASADFDLNGGPDLAVTTQTSKVGVFLNTR